MKYITSLLEILPITVCLFLTNIFIAHSKDLAQKFSLYCETTSIYYSYSNNISYIKDLHSHKRDFYSEIFRIEILSSERAIKKYANAILADEAYSIVKAGSLYRLKSVNGSEYNSAVIDLSSGKYTSVSEKSDALIRIKENGTCIEQH